MCIKNTKMKHVRGKWTWGITWLVEGKPIFVLSMKKREDKGMVTFIFDWFCISHWKTVWKSPLCLNAGITLFSVNIEVSGLENDNTWVKAQSCASRPASVIRLLLYGVITAIIGTLTKATCCGEHFSYENEHQQHYATNHKTVTEKRYRPPTHELCSMWLCAM